MEPSLKAETLSATLRRVALPAVAINLVLLWLARDQLARLAGASLHPPDWEPLLRAGWVVQLHLLAAISALLVALLILAGPKGTRAHRIFGWGWAVLMLTTALSSFFIRDIGDGKLSYIHILSGWVAFATPLGVWAARTRRVRLHQRLMTGLVLGGLVIAGAFTFVPGRLMFDTFLG
jgi:uncharacterized membrane protein